MKISHGPRHLLGDGVAEANLSVACVAQPRTSATLRRPTFHFVQGFQRPGPGILLATTGLQSADSAKVRNVTSGHDSPATGELSGPTSPGAAANGNPK
jgi:hypothetical protein